MNVELFELTKDQANYGVGAFVDVETTGLDFLENEILELCIVLFVYERKSRELIGAYDEYTGLREPDGPISRKSSEINGIYRRHVKGKSFDMGRIIELLEQAEFLVAHNAEFDASFIQFIKRSPPFTWYCSMTGIDWASHNHSRRGLQYLLSRHKIDAGEAHRASSDVHAAIELLKYRKKSGITYFQEMLSNPPLYDGIKIQAANLNRLAEKETIGAAQQIASAVNSSSEIRQKPLGCFSTLTLPILLVVLLKILY